MMRKIYIYYDEVYVCNVFAYFFSWIIECEEFILPDWSPPDNPIQSERANSWIMECEEFILPDWSPHVNPIQSECANSWIMECEEFILPDWCSCWCWCWGWWSSPSPSLSHSLSPSPFACCRLPQTNQWIAEIPTNIDRSSNCSNSGSRRAMEGIKQRKIIQIQWAIWWAHQIKSNWKGVVTQMLTFFPLGIWFFDAQNTFHFIFRRLKMHFSCPFHDYQLKLCSLTAPHIAH